MITPDDAAQILSAIAAYDQRTVGVMESQAWAAALNHDNPNLRLADAIQAVVAWHAETIDDIRMKPAHVIQRAKLIAKARAAAASDHAPGCWNIVPEFGAAAAEQIRALPAGHQPAEGSGLRELHRMLEEIAAKRAMPEVDENESASDRIYRSALVRARADKRERRRGNRVG